LFEVARARAKPSQDVAAHYETAEAAATRKREQLPESAWTDTREMKFEDPRFVTGGEPVAPASPHSPAPLATAPAAPSTTSGRNDGPVEMRVIGAEIIESESPQVTVVASDVRENVDALLDVVAVGGEARFHCTGILIAPRAVLSARHCLPATRVLFGNSVDQPLMVSRVVRANTPTTGADVAVLFLETAATLRARKWHDASDAAPAPLGRIVGFGATDSAAARGTGVKRAARIPLDGWGCDLSRSRTAGCNPEFEMVVATPGGVDTCDGDSGGPLLERNGGEWRLLGITSRPIASSRKRCGDGGVCTRIDKVAGFVKRALREAAHDFQRPELK
jgi:hypothetical protein